MVMSIGFCVDYTVEVMHFASLAPPGSPASRRFEYAMKAAGYDVLHGSVTGAIGCCCLIALPAEAPMKFGQMTLIMIVYGGTYALWSLPSLLSLVDDVRGKRAQVTETRGPTTEVGPA